MIGFENPVRGLVDVFVERPGTTAATSCRIGRRVEVVAEHRRVGRVRFVNDLENDIEVCVLCERVHSSVGNRDVDVSVSFTDDAEEPVDWVDFYAGYSDVFAVHLNNSKVVVLSVPAEVINPVSEVVGRVSDNDIWRRS